MARVFVSHASEDQLVAARLHGWLVDDGHEVFLDRDLRDGIAVGEVWEQRLYERLRWADAVVCLITSAYRGSAWCTAEVGIAGSLGSPLLPVLAEPGQMHPLLPSSRYQYTDLAGDPDAARAAMGEALRRVDAAGGLGWADGRSPFPDCNRSRTTCTGCSSADTPRWRRWRACCAHRPGSPAAGCCWWWARRGAASRHWSVPGCRR